MGAENSTTSHSGFRYNPRLLRRGNLRAALVVATLVGIASGASAQPSLHGAVGVGTGYTPIKRLATFSTREIAPVFSQIEVGGSLGPMGSISHAAHLAVTSGFSEGFSLRVMPSYLLYRRSSLKLAQFARLGLPLVLVPETVYGLEVGGGLVWFLTAGLGLFGELDVDFYRGIENEMVVGGQLGGFVSYEVLPR